MRVQLTIHGTTPMLMHNIQLADPDNPWVKQIAELTSKRKKTEDDRKEIGRLEWFGGLYVDNGQIILPTGNIRKALVNAGKITKQGTQVTRAVHFADLNVPLAYDGSADINELYKDESFRNRSAVGIQGKRTMRVRPQFSTWAAVTEVEVLEEIMDLDDFVRIADRAGKAEGIGDNRVNGYGRFTAEVK